MRILHFANDFYPRVTGGTEIFVHQLMEAQQKLDPTVQVISAAHVSRPDPRCHISDIALEPNQRLLPAIVGGDRLSRVAATASSFPGFTELLAEFRPDVVHFHSFSEQCGLSHARSVKAAGARLVVSVHAPGFSCMKGNLIDASGAICDGVLRERRCTRCRLHNGGLPRLIAGAISLQQGWPLSCEMPGKVAHVLTARQLTAAFHQAWRDFAELADALHVYPAWNRDVLLRQGFPANKVHLVHTAGPPPLLPRQRTPMQDGLFRLVYRGRCHPVKGLHLVIQAILDLPSNAPIQLDFYGPYWDSAYGKDLLQRIDGDSRFRLLGNLPKDVLLPRLQEYDLAVVPSTWLETGPLTVYEAFSAGIPVAGSNLGGIKELLEGVQGCSLLPLDWRSWRNYFARLLTGALELDNFCPPPSRQFSDVAKELYAVYK